MRTFWGLMRAYWFSDRWKEAWTLTLFIAVLTALASKASVWMAESSGDLVNAIAFFHDRNNSAPLTAILSSGGTLLLARWEASQARDASAEVLLAGEVVPHLRREAG